MIQTTEGWASPQRILVVLAHPDDPEFFCGASIARWVAQGHTVSYCLLTNGNKGAQDRAKITPEQLAELRVVEQTRAAAVLGVTQIEFIGIDDGCLLPDLAARKAVTRVIRKVKPDILVSCDPLNFYPMDTYINHPDHRAAGQIALEAVFPAAGNPFFFPELMDDEGLMPHTPREVWLSSTPTPNVVLDVSAYWEQKITALHGHSSQIGPDLEKFNQRMRSRRTPDSTDEQPRYEELFKKLIFR